MPTNLWKQLTLVRVLARLSQFVLSAPNALTNLPILKQLASSAFIVKGVTFTIFYAFIASGKPANGATESELKRSLDAAGFDWSIENFHRWGVSEGHGYHSPSCIASQADEEVSPLTIKITGKGRIRFYVKTEEPNGPDRYATERINITVEGTEQKLVIPSTGHYDWQFVEFQLPELKEYQVNFLSEKKVRTLIDRLSYLPDIGMESYGYKGGGTLSISPQQTHFEVGDQVELSIIPDEGWKFERWEGDIVSNDETVKFAFDPNISIQGILTYDLEFQGEQWTGGGTQEWQVIDEELRSEHFNSQLWIAQAVSGPAVLGLKGQFLDRHSQLEVYIDDTPVYSLVEQRGYRYFEPDVEIPIPSGIHSIKVEYRGGEFENGISISELSTQEGYRIGRTTTGSGKIEITPLKTSYKAGEIVKIEASPVDGHVFAGWSGNAVTPQMKGQTVFNYTVTGHENFKAAFIEDYDYGMNLLIDGSQPIVNSTDPLEADHEFGKPLVIESASNWQQTPSTLSATVQGPGAVSYWTRIEEPDFSLNGELQNAFRKRYYPRSYITYYHRYDLPPGNHQLQWRFRSDDELLFAPTFTPGYRLDVWPDDNVERVPDKTYYQPGEKVTLMVKDDPDLEFMFWSHDKIHHTDSIELVMNQSHLVRAGFTQHGGNGGKFRWKIGNEGNGDGFVWDSNYYDGWNWSGRENGLDLTWVEGEIDGPSVIDYHGNPTGSFETTVLVDGKPTIDDPIHLTEGRHTIRWETRQTKLAEWPYNNSHGIFFPKVLKESGLRIHNSNGGGVEVSPQKDSYTIGEYVDIRAIPKEGFHFVRWDKDFQWNTDRLTLKMDDSYEIMPIFGSSVQFLGDTWTVEGDWAWSIEPLNGESADSLVMKDMPQRSRLWDEGPFSSTIHITGNGPGKVKFDAYYTHEDFVVSVNGEVTHNPISDTWTPIEIDLLSGPQTIEIEVTNGYNSRDFFAGSAVAAVRNVELPANFDIQPTFLSYKTNNITWKSSLNSQWKLTSTGLSNESISPFNLSAEKLEAAVSGPGDLSFRWSSTDAKPPSQMGIRLSIDGLVAFEESLTDASASITNILAIPSGEHTIELETFSEPNFEGASNAFFGIELKNLVFQPAATKFRRNLIDWATGTANIFALNKFPDLVYGDLDGDDLTGYQELLFGTHPLIPDPKQWGLGHIKLDGNEQSPVGLWVTKSTSQQPHLYFEVLDNSQTWQKKTFDELKGSGQTSDYGSHVLVNLADIVNGSHLLIRLKYPTGDE